MLNTTLLKNKKIYQTLDSLKQKGYAYYISMHDRIGDKEIQL
tara:strand:- start:389 stop:514 length:126 start_codon:yes stop_codon:yes gene_type:complete